MELQIVSLQTANLLKEIGFDWETDKVWFDSYYYPDEYPHNKAKLLWKDALDLIQRGFPEYQFPAPTQELLKKWFRDVHNIICEVKYNYTDEESDINFFDTMIYCDIDEESKNEEIFDNYEIGLERTLFEACEYLKKKLTKADGDNTK